MMDKRLPWPYARTRIDSSLLLIAVARAQIVVTLLQKDGLLSLSEDDVDIIARDTKGKVDRI